MAETVTEIVNAGFRKIGATQVLTDYDTDTSDLAKTARNIWPILFDSVLRSYDWTCARARKQYLSTDATEPAFTTDYVFQHILPTDPWCLRPLYFDDTTMEFRIEGRKILTNYATVNLHYTKRITDMSEVDALLSQVMVYLFAAEAAPVVKGNTKLPIEITGFIHEVWLPLARGASGREGVVEPTEAKRVHRLIDRSDYV